MSETSCGFWFNLKALAGIMKSFLCVMVWLVSTLEAADLPSFIHVCHKDDPHLQQCFESAVEDLRPFLVTGVPECNIPSIEPLIMKDLIREEVAGLKIITNHVKAFGCSDYFVRQITVDVENQVYQMDIDIPALRIEAEYSIDGKLLLMPIKGNGDMTANVTNCKSKTKLRGELYEKDGEKYLRYTDIEIKIQVGEGKVKLRKLFGGDKILNDVVNDVVNKNLDMFLKELMPVIEKGLQSTFLDIGNSIVGPYTFKQLFPH